MVARAVALPSNGWAMAVSAGLGAGGSLALQWWARRIQRTRIPGRRYTSLDAAVDPEVVQNVRADAYEGTKLATARHDYCAAHSSPLSEALSEVWRETERHLRLPQMLSSPLTVHVLQALIRVSEAKRVLEIGTYTGYTAIGMAEVLPSDGLVLCLDDFSDEAEAELLCERLIRQSGVGHRIELRKQRALEALRELDGTFDLCYIDADKENQLAYLEMLRPLVAEKGSVVVDNTLWYSQVLRPSSRHDEATAAVAAFNEAVLKAWHVTMLPVRDGLDDPSTPSGFPVNGGAPRTCSSS